MLVGEDGVEEVVLEVDAGEGFAVMALDGEVLLVGGAVGKRGARGRGGGRGRGQTLRAAWVGG